MNRNDLSDFVIRLTDSASTLRPLEFHCDLISLVGSIARFDSAWWGWSVIRERNLSFVHSRTLNLSEGFVARAKAQLETDPFVQRGRRMRLFSHTLARSEVASDTDLARVMDDYAIAQILAGHSQVREGPFNFFMSLYRGPRSPAFSREEIGDLRLLLRHFQQALSLSLRLSLEAQVGASEEWALVDAGGEVFLRSAGFPASAGGCDRGRRKAGTVLRTERYSDDLQLVVAVAGAEVAGLTAREHEVCRLYLEGLSRRDVAHALGLSENTVRNQIASIYRKTGCRDKLGLHRAAGGAS